MKYKKYDNIYKKYFDGFMVEITEMTPKVFLMEKILAWLSRFFIFQNISYNIQK